VTIELSRLEFLSGVPSPMASKVAAAKAFHEAYEKGKPYLLESVMAAEIVVPDEFLGGGHRRGARDPVRPHGGHAVRP